METSASQSGHAIADNGDANCIESIASTGGVIERLEALQQARLTATSRPLVQRLDGELREAAVSGTTLSAVADRLRCCADRFASPSGANGRADFGQDGAGRRDCAGASMQEVLTGLEIKKPAARSRVEVLRAIADAAIRDGDYRNAARVSEAVCN